MAVTVATILVVCSVRAEPGAVVTLDEVPLVWAKEHGAAASRAVNRETWSSFMTTPRLVSDMPA
jgi:hypothetical protein